MLTSNSNYKEPYCFQDLINGGESFEKPSVVLNRIEEQIRNKNNKFNGFEKAINIYFLVRKWDFVKEHTFCKSPSEYLQHKLNISDSSFRKNIHFGKILIDYKYLFEKIDIEKVKSVHMLDHFKRALENHPEEKVMKALTTMTVREFERFSKRRPLYAHPPELRSPLPKERQISNRTSIFIDYSRYQAILLDSIENDKTILTVGTDSNKTWDQITSALIREGYELSFYEPNTPYASATIIRKKPLLD